MDVNSTAAPFATDLTPRGQYGFDASPAAAAGLAAVGMGLIAVSVWAYPRHTWGALIGGFLVSTVAIYVHTTRRGKFLAWTSILRQLPLRGDERVLDVGCGRGAVLTMVAKLIPRGEAVGLDRWSSADQSGNGPAAAKRNLVSEGVRDRCRLVTGDMRALPFPNASFDLIVSSLAVHNILDAGGRLQAIHEIARVIKPGGQVALADLAATRAYARELAANGLEVRRRDLGWRFWWAPLVGTTHLVLATKSPEGRRSHSPTPDRA